MSAKRYYVRSPDGTGIAGYDQRETAERVALEFGDGAAVVDTLAQAYHPMVEEVVAGELKYIGIGGWDTGRFGMDRDLIDGIKKGHAAIVHAFLAKGANANAADRNGGPALHWAVASGNVESVRLLLTHGADAENRDRSGQTAWDLAEKRHQTEITALLCEKPQRPH